jgi:hypothetical protein
MKTAKGSGGGAGYCNENRDKKINKKKKVNDLGEALTAAMGIAQKSL